MLSIFQSLFEAFLVATLWRWYSWCLHVTESKQRTERFPHVSKVTQLLTGERRNLNAGNLTPHSMPWTTGRYELQETFINKKYKLTKNYVMEKMHHESWQSEDLAHTKYFIPQDQSSSTSTENYANYNLKVIFLSTCSTSYWEKIFWNNCGCIYFPLQLCQFGFIHLAALLLGVYTFSTLVFFLMKW